MARHIPHGMEIMVINRLIPVLFVVRTIGGGVTAVDGSASAVIPTLLERCYSGWISSLGGVTPKGVANGKN